MDVSLNYERYHNIIRMASEEARTNQSGYRQENVGLLIIEAMELYITYRELLQMDPPPVMIPGPRVTMKEGTLAALWMYQHQGTLMKMVFALEGMDHLDFAMAAWRDFPDLVENGDPGHG